jgi:hypothetical protein
MAMLEDFAHFRGALIKKIVFDRKLKIQPINNDISDVKLTSQIYGGLTLHLSHINHKFFDESGNDAWKLTFQSVLPGPGFEALFHDCYTIKRIETISPDAIITLDNGKIIRFCAASMRLTPG